MNEAWNDRNPEAQNSNESERAIRCPNRPLILHLLARSCLRRRRWLLGLLRLRWLRRLCLLRFGRELIVNVFSDPQSVISEDENQQRKDNDQANTLNSLA